MAVPKCPKCGSKSLLVIRYKWGDQVFFGRPLPIWTKSSLIRCIQGHEWRTQAKYVEALSFEEGADMYNVHGSIGNEGVKPE